MDRKTLAPAPARSPPSEQDLTPTPHGSRVRSIAGRRVARLAVAPNLSAEPSDSTSQASTSRTSSRRGSVSVSSEPRIEQHTRSGGTHQYTIPTRSSGRVLVSTFTTDNSQNSRSSEPSEKPESSRSLRHGGTVRPLTISSPPSSSNLHGQQNSRSQPTYNNPQVETTGTHRTSVSLTHSRRAPSGSLDNINRGYYSSHHEQPSSPPPHTYSRETESNTSVSLNTYGNSRNFPLPPIRQMFPSIFDHPQSQHAPYSYTPSPMVADPRPRSPPSTTRHQQPPQEYQHAPTYQAQTLTSQVPNAPMRGIDTEYEIRVKGRSEDGRTYWATRTWNEEDQEWGPWTYTWED
ncbi:hypothetical protein B0J11DRAFT_501829 [Dendryphion nanum]|uniref:Uncharacterized protein n=1 Tax=Dendryphion nanum TaxID=256645 RepID=A0A9P9ITN5_9PLEO|nr:hypothetical protein B0J11DRAFT_501829 [Dendryphion nanum]